MSADSRLVSEQFSRSSRYDPEWVLASASGGANSLWLTEWLTEVLNLRAGMRVLDLGCGMAASSIFLWREFGVQVWATDLWFSASQNLQRIQDAGAGDAVFPIHADARALPFANEFFDAAVSIDAFPYFGTDDLYLNYLLRVVKPGGLVGIAGAGLMQEIEGAIPDHLAAWWEPGLSCLHSPSSRRPSSTNPSCPSPLSTRKLPYSAPSRILRELCPYGHHPPPRHHQTPSVVDQALLFGAPE